jgi:hypothetical protein
MMTSSEERAIASELARELSEALGPALQPEARTRCSLTRGKLADLLVSLKLTKRQKNCQRDRAEFDLYAVVLEEDAVIFVSLRMDHFAEE